MRAHGTPIAGMWNNGTSVGRRYVTVTESDPRRGRRLRKGVADGADGWLGSRVRGL